jgi:hypothetical protein
MVEEFNLPLEIIDRKASEPDRAEAGSKHVVVPRPSLTSCVRPLPSAACFNAMWLQVTKMKVGQDIKLAHAFICVCCSGGRCSLTRPTGHVAQWPTADRGLA